MNIVPVILSGGSGTRLWPLSRQTYPKQFLNLLDDKSLFQGTLDRIKGISDLPPVIVTSEQHRFLAAEQVRQQEIENAAIILEPVGRNTAPAIAVAAMRILEQHERAVALVLPSDHIINDREAFFNAVKSGYQAAEAGKLVTFGIVPTKAETGFGYIKSGNSSVADSFEVASFVEKPDKETAEEYLLAGNYFWNSGMFMFHAKHYLDELEKHQPEMVLACKESLANGAKDLDFYRLDTASFAQCPADSIDYAVMEKTSDAVVIPLDAGWDDVGSWTALASLNAHDESGNTFHGDVIIENTSNSLVYSDHRLVSAIGVKDLVIVETADAVLVAHKSEAQNVGKIVAKLKLDTRPEASEHRLIYRPWGHYDSVDYGNRFKVKRITVNPGAELSLQKHHHRAEHWIVVTGTAEVTCDDSIFLLKENESTFIPLGSVHRLANRGKIPLEMIEVQSGSYLGEDDIVRLDDNYGRKGTNI